MKKYILIATSMFLITCGESLNDLQYIISSSSGFTSSSSSEEINFSSSSFYVFYPQMDERVVAYIGGDYEDYMSKKIITDIDKLKELFKVALNEENFDNECDYFAISAYVSDGLTYLVVSKEQNEKLDPNDDILAVYHIYPSLEQPLAPSWAANECMYPQSFHVYGILICDKNGGLKHRINFPPTIIYNDPTWDCWNGETRIKPWFELKE